MKKFFAEFKKFISRGNILDMAVGVIVGGAFSAIVTSLTNHIIRPFINWILALCTNGDGLSAVYTFLKKATMIDTATGKEVVDLANSIYIDWGAFITAIIDFLIIAFTIFTVIKIIMKSQEMFKKTAQDLEKAHLNKEEKKMLKERGVNIKDREAVKAAFEEIKKEEEEKKKAEEASKPKVETEADILKEIRELMKKQLETNSSELSNEANENN